MSDIASPLPIALIPCPGILPMSEASEADFRARLITEALSWVGTPYRQLGGTKGVSVDCAMLLVRCVIDIGLVEPFDPRPYPPAWFLHREDERYIDWLAMVAKETDTPKAGDFIAVQIGRAFAHSGIIVDDELLVHAFADEGQCNLTPLRHPRIAKMGRNNEDRPRRYFDLFARLRERDT